MSAMNVITLLLSTLADAFSVGEALLRLLEHAKKSLSVVIFTTR